MRPLRFQPLIKQARWGGRQLGTLLGKPIGDDSNYAESWEIADHGDDQSVVVDGEFAGWSLQQVLQHCGEELLGEHAGLNQFPLLIKFLDAHDRLSVQVHPNDEQAKRFDPTENGKTEAWVIIAAEPGSQLYAGLKAGIDKSLLRKALMNGTIEDVLHTIPVQSGDSLFVPAGSVHAISEGILLAEIQQQSDLTFRLYDWGRVGTDGHPREVHIEESIACIDFERGPLELAKPPSPDADGRQRLVDCEQFIIDRITCDQPSSIANDGHCHVLMVLHGTVELTFEDATMQLSTGQTALIPAVCNGAQLSPVGQVILLDAYLPTR